MLRNRALKIELIMVVITIFIPMAMIITGMEANFTVVPIFTLLFVLFYYIKENAYKLYKIKGKSNKEEEIIEEEKKWVRNKKKVATKTGLQLLGVGIILFIVGNLLGDTLENLNSVFNIPEWAIGIILGFITSIPELITFIEAQRHSNMKLNNVDGVVEATSNLFTSNILNLFVIESLGIVIFILFS